MQWWQNLDRNVLQIMDSCRKIATFLFTCFVKKLSYNLLISDNDRWKLSDLDRFMIYKDFFLFVGKLSQLIT